MKIRLFVWTALTLVLAACNKNSNENLTDGPVAAEFHASIYKAITTRASGTQWDDGDCIGITGIGTVYDNVPYLLKNGMFMADGTNIYFHSTDEVSFRAYYPYSQTGGTLSATTDANTQMDQPAIDFLFASGATGSTTNPNVNFVDNTQTGGTDCSFHHCMSQTYIEFLEGNGVDLAAISPANYTLNNLVLSGTFNTSTGVATASSEGASALTMELNGALESSVILFPQSTSSLPLNISYNDQTYYATLTVPDGELMAGKSYVYKVFINNSGISVESTGISGWETIEGDDAHAEM